MNFISIKTALRHVPQLIELAREAQASIRRLGLDEQLGRGLDGLMRIVPTRAVPTLSLPFAAASFGAGVVTGATVTALFTPKRGDELRAEIRERLQSARQRVTTRSSAEPTSHEGNGKGGEIHAA